MFKKPATVLPFRPSRPTSVQGAKFSNCHSNDTRPVVRRCVAPRPRARLAPVCHWIELDGRLECRWIGDNGGSRNDEEPRPFTSSRWQAA